jgi:hypothetical protein
LCFLKESPAPACFRSAMDTVHPYLHGPRQALFE